MDSTDKYASVYFSPGAFIKAGDTGYNATATGQVVATATWTNMSGIPITRNVTLVWKNYPYISTSSLGDCGNSQVGDKINITIRLSGDGTALLPKPIDVVLLNDRSGSMLQGGNPDRMVSAKAAGSLFFSKLASSDKIGEISFGDTRWAQLVPLYVSATNQWNWENVYSYGYWAMTDDTGWNTATGGDCHGCVRRSSYPWLNSFTYYSLTSPASSVRCIKLQRGRSAGLRC